MPSPLTPHQLAVLGMDLDELVEEAACGFDLDTIVPRPGGGYHISVSEERLRRTAASRVPAPRGPPPNSRPSNDQWMIPSAPRKPMASIFAADSSRRKGPIPLKTKRGPRLQSSESIGRYAYLAGRIVDDCPFRSEQRREMLRLIGQIWCAGEELTPGEVRRVLADALKVRNLVPKLALGQHKRVLLYSHLKALIEDLQGRLQLRLFE